MLVEILEFWGSNACRFRGLWWVVGRSSRGKRSTGVEYFWRGWWGAETSSFDLKVQARTCVAAKTPGAVLARVEVMASSEWRTAG
jgi:hypothetical protein